MKQVLMVNDRSRGGRGLPGALVAWLRSNPEVRLWHSSDLSVFERDYQALGLTDVDRLLVYGGDGTVQALLTNLLGCAEVPELVLLPGGSTNMSASGINRSRRLRTVLGALAGGRFQVQPRPVLCIRDAESQRAGFFFGVGQVVSGIEFANARLFQHDAMRREGASGLALLRVLWGLRRGEQGFSRGVALRLEPDAGAARPPSEFTALLLVATTLPRLLFGFQPFWNQPEVADLKVTWVYDGAPGLWRRLPGLLGVPGFRESRRRPPAQAGYHSAALDGFRLRLDGPYTIDGEVFAQPARDLEVAVTRRFRFLVL